MFYHTEPTSGAGPQPYENKRGLHGRVLALESVGKDLTSMNMIPLVVSWAVLASAVLALALYRKSIAAKEDDNVHVNTDMAAQQIALAKKLEGIDRWGKILTIIAGVFGLILVALFLYNGWVNPPKPD
jgi:peptidoglycan/LPS O-acetylase OafA/YrhL